MKNFLTFFFTLLATVNAFAFRGNPDPPRKSGIEFVKNQNQWDAQVKYRAAVPGGFVFVRKNALQYSFYDYETVHKIKHPHSAEEAEEVKDQKDVKAHSFLVSFEGAELNSEIKSEGLQEHYYNFFLGNSPDKWARNVEVFEKIRQNGIYEGIDMALFHNGTSLKYEFYVQAGANPDKIRMRYDYADGLEIDRGNLIIKTSVNTIMEQKPYCYQVIDGVKKEVRSRFELNKNVVTFKFQDKINPNYPLVIDPILVFSTFSGAASDNWGNSATYDRQGNLYSLGTSFGAGFPVTFGAFQVGFAGQIDVSMMKYNSTGTGLMYGAFLGGSNVEVPHTSIVNRNNELVIMGTTSSPNFPTTFGAYDPTFNGGTPVSPMSGIDYVPGCDIFVSIISVNGNSLLGSTFLGGSGNDGISLFDYNMNKLTYNYGDQFRGDIAIDDANNVYIASTTRSMNFPLVNPSFTTPAGGQDAVVVRFTPYLNSVTWSTYYGGNRHDAAHSIKLSGTGDVYIGGGTNSSDLPVHSGSVQPFYTTFADILSDGYVARFNGAGAFLGATYIGTQDYDQVFFLDIDNDNNVYAFGQTRGALFFPVSTIYGALYSRPNSSQFIQKFNPGLTSRFFSTLVGSGRTTPDISPTAFMVNSCGHIYLAGWGGNINNFPGYGGSSSVSGMPVSADAIKPSTDGDDFYMMILSRNAENFLYGTFFGSTFTAPPRGDHVDGGTSRFDKEKGTIYHATCACNGNDFPITPGAWSATNNSPNCNNASFKISFDTLKAKIESYSMAGIAGVREGCHPLRLRFKNLSYGGRTFQWYLGSSLISTSPTEIVVSFPGPGTYTVKLVISDPLICNGKDSAQLVIKVHPADFRAEKDTTICAGQSVQLNASGSISYAWFPTTGLSNPNIANPVASPASTTTYQVAMLNSFGCRDTLSVKVTVLPKLKGDFEIKVKNPCDSLQQVEIKNLSEGGNVYQWNFGNGNTSTLYDPPVQTYTAGTYTITLWVKNTVCKDSVKITKTFTIFKNNVRIMNDTTVCYGQRIRLWASGGQNYTWTPNTGLSDTTSGAPYVTLTQTTVFTVKVTGPGGCEIVKQIRVTVLPQVKADFDLEVEGACEGKPRVRLTNKSSGANSYLWNFGNGSTSTAFNPPPVVYTADGTYVITLIARNAAGCPDTLRKAVPIFINGFSAGFDTTICHGGSVRLFAGGGESYRWEPAASLDNPNSPTPLATPATTTDYIVTIQGRGGCVFKDTVRVTVLDEVIADFDVKLTAGCDTLPWVIINNKSKGGASYFWNFGDGRTSTDKDPKPYRYTSTGVYVITLIVWGADKRCPDTLSKQVTIRRDNLSNFMRNIKLSPEPTICAGESAELFASGGQSYSWSPATGLSATNIPNPVASPATTTVYKVRIANEGGCYIDTVLKVVVLPKVEPKFTYTVSSDCGKPSTLIFDNQSDPSANFVWVMGNGDTLRTFAPNGYTYEKGGTYQVTLITESGKCTQTKTLSVNVDNVMPPNVITPNGDNKNDKFVIQSARSGWKLIVFDRWEKEIFRSDDYKNDWGPDNSSTTYYYLLTSPDGNTCRGWIQVLGNK
jgi:gliding motility-associated-like protein